MKVLTSIFLIVLGATGCAVVDNGRGEPQTKCPADRPCVEVDPAHPEDVPFATNVSKSGDGAFSFLLKGGPGQGNAWLIFKCQVMAEQNPDCRTPARDSDGDELWAIKLNLGKLKSVDLIDDQVCTMCLEAQQNDCAAQACRYPYMVVDLGRPGQQPVDPVLIVIR